MTKDNIFKIISIDFKKFIKGDREYHGRTLIVGGLLLLFQQTFFYFFSGNAIEIFWWIGLVCVVVGIFLKFRSIKKEFKKYWTRYTYRLAIALLLETMMIYFFIQFMHVMDTWTRIKLIVTVIIMFFCILYLRDRTKRVFEIPKKRI